MNKVAQIWQFLRLERKINMKKRLLVCVMIGIFLLAGVLVMYMSPSENLEGVDWNTLHTYGDVTEENTRIGVQTIGNENVLILPSTVSPGSVPLFYDFRDSVEVYDCNGLKSTAIKSGDTVDLTDNCRDGKYTITLKAKKDGETSEFTVNLFFADHIGTMYLVSDDPKNEGRLWVESSPDKSNKATGSMLLQNGDGSIVYNDALTQIKGRGNATWNMEKKPYQIKLSEKTDLLQTGNADNKAKTWVLLANFVDSTTMRNTLIYNLGLELGMDFCTENNWVNLYYDGEYRGCYLLSEKVEIGSGRVDITDLEELNEKTNKAVDLKDFPVALGMSANGAVYTYCVGMESPEDITGGYLLEMEFDMRVEAEVCYFTTSRGQNIVVKSPEYASKEEMEYIASLYQEWEDALYNGGVNPATGKKYTEYVDLRSAAIYYLANEFSKNADGFQSSTYFYKDHDSDLMYMGPLWDFDVTMNNRGDLEPTGMYTAKAGLGAALCKFGDFREEVKKSYLEQMSPVVKNVILGDADALSNNGIIRSISYYDATLSNSAACNNLIWVHTKKWEPEVAQLRKFVSERAEYLDGEISAWSADIEFILPESPYRDVDNKAWYCEDVYKAGRYGLMVSGGLDDFYPLDSAIRAQVIQTLYNMAGRPVVSYGGEFSDVERYSWYANAVSWGVQNGVLSDSSDRLFYPTEYSTREDAIVMLYRYMGSPQVSGDLLNQYVDADKVSDEARNAMEWALEEDLIVIQNNELRPQDAIIRAELASVLVRFYEKFLMN